MIGIEYATATSLFVPRGFGTEYEGLLYMQHRRLANDQTVSQTFPLLCLLVYSDMALLWVSPVNPPNTLAHEGYIVEVFGSNLEVSA